MNELSKDTEDLMFVRDAVALALEAVSEERPGIMPDMLALGAVQAAARGIAVLDGCFMTNFKWGIQNFIIVIKELAPEGANIQLEIRKSGDK